MTKMKDIKDKHGRVIGTVFDFDGDGSLWDEVKMRKEWIERHKNIPRKYKFELV